MYAVNHTILHTTQLDMTQWALESHIKQNSSQTNVSDSDSDFPVNEVSQARLGFCDDRIGI